MQGARLKPVDELEATLMGPVTEVNNKIDN
jgi:hypothetical protein